MVQYMGIIEQRTTEILQAYAASQIDLTSEVLPNQSEETSVPILGVKTFSARFSSSCRVRRRSSFSSLLSSPELMSLKEGIIAVLLRSK